LKYCIILRIFEKSDGLAYNIQAWHIVHFYHLPTGGSRGRFPPHDPVLVIIPTPLRNLFNQPVSLYVYTIRAEITFRKQLILQGFGGIGSYHPIQISRFDIHFQITLYLTSKSADFSFFEFLGFGNIEFSRILKCLKVSV
jgi:hypothetical protein